MNIRLAIRYGQLVRAAYDFANANVVAPEQLPAAYDDDQLTYKVISVISANDLWTDINVLRPIARVPIGLVLLDAAYNAVIAIRGTLGIFEWVHDALYLQKPCPIVGGVGNTEDGFTDMYESLQPGVAGGAQSLLPALLGLPWSIPTANIQSLTICGHSLGSSIATLLAYDVAKNSTISSFNSPAVYTFASPRTGDPQFALDYNATVKNTFRVANTVDLVPHLPTELPIAQVPFYHHAGELNELEPFVDVPQYQNLLQRTVPCHHIIESYLHLMYLEAGIAPVFPLTQECVVQLGSVPKVPGTAAAVS